MTQWAEIRGGLIMDLHWEVICVSWTNLLVFSWVGWGMVLPYSSTTQEKSNRLVYMLMGAIVE